MDVKIDMEKKKTYDFNEILANEKILIFDKEVVLSLTGKDSHKFLFPSGQGSLSIGTIGNVNREYDLLVNEDDVIYWETFNGYYSVAGWKEKDRYPYGNMPRFFYYSGNDTGFIDWSSKREIEEFRWIPQKDMSVDFTNSKIYLLYIKTKEYYIDFSLGEQVSELHLCGHLDHYLIKNCKKVPRLYFEPEYDKNIESYKLPIFSVLKDAEEVQVTVSALSAPFDCSSLLQFPKLKKIYLNGNITNLEALKELEDLNTLGIWNAPNLSGMPKLTVWDHLSWFVASTIDEEVGKVLRKELSSLKKKRKFEFSYVGKLRSPLWFEQNYGIPFAYWENKNGKKATSAYKKCLKEVKSSKTEEKIKKAIINFVEKINKLEDIESMERDDVYSSLCSIMKSSPIEIGTKKWETWFDKAREF